MTNGDRFVSFFGASAAVCAQIWEDLQVIGIEEALILPNGGDTFKFEMHMIRSVWDPEVILSDDVCRIS